MRRSSATPTEPFKPVRQIGNALANYAGGMTALGAMLGFQALYAHMTGAEIFGLISLLFTASLVLPAFDLGIGRTAGRIIAERLPNPTAADQLRTEVMTLQAANAAVGLVLGAALALASKWIAVTWLRPEGLGSAEIATAVTLIGANIPCLMARQFATAGLNAMQRQTLANTLLVVFVLLRGGAGIFALSRPNPAITFLLFQLLVNAFDVLISLGIFSRLLPGGRVQPTLDLAVIRDRWRFAAGDGATSLLGISMMHLDKVLLGALLPLSVYGTYCLVAAIATGIGRMAGPVAVAFLPRFVELFSSGQRPRLDDEYLLATQLTSCIVFPVAAVLAVFAPEVVAALLPDHALKGEFAVVFTLLIIAFTISNLMQLPHAIQLASGNSAIALRFGAANAAAYLLLVIPLTLRIGMLAPGIVLLSVYGISLFFFLRVTRRVARISVRRWLGEGAGKAILASLATALTADWLLPSGIGPLWGSCALLASISVASGVALAITPDAWFAMRDFALHAVGRTRAELNRL